MALKSEIISTQWTYDFENAGKIVQGLDCIKQSVFLILITQKGSDPLRPNFGCGVYDFIDMPVNFAIPRMIKEIVLALTQYEPRIEEIKVTQALNVSAVSFTVGFKVKNTKKTDQLNITYGNTRT